MSVGPVAITIKAVDKASAVLWHMIFRGWEFNAMLTGELVVPAGRILSGEEALWAEEAG